MVEDLLNQWEANPPKHWGDLAGDRAERSLIRVAGTAPTEGDPDSWETPTSMRNVDVGCRAEVRKYPKMKDDANGPQ